MIYSIHRRIQDITDQLEGLAKIYARENQENVNAINHALDMAQKIRKGGVTEELSVEVKNAAGVLSDSRQYFLAAHLDMIAETMVKELRQQKILHMD